MRTCRSCGKSEAEVRFYDPASVAGRAAGSMCQPCWVAKSVQWRRDHRDQWNEKRHRAKLRRQFGITDEQYDKLYRDPRCAGCGKTRGQLDRRLALDHDHATGRRRGLLCHDCNRTLATAHDNPAVLRQLAKYLEEVRNQ